MQSETEAVYTLAVETETEFGLTDGSYDEYADDIISIYTDQFDILYECTDLDYSFYWADAIPIPAGSYYVRIVHNDPDDCLAFSPRVYLTEETNVLEPVITNEDNSGEGYYYFRVPSVFYGGDKLYECSPLHSYAAIKAHLKAAFDRVLAA